MVLSSYKIDIVFMSFILLSVITITDGFVDLLSLWSIDVMSISVNDQPIVFYQYELLITASSD